MSQQYEETSSTEGYKCPYCGYEPTAEAEEHEYDGAVVECEECGKKFHATAQHDVTFWAHPSCELNNEEHDWQPGFNPRFMWCAKCGKGDLAERIQQREKEQTA